MNVLQNERHCGDVKARKTYTPNYLDHKAKPNRQNRNQYYRRDHHEAIINRDDFITVQRLIQNQRYGHQGLLPQIHVIADGALKGFVEINPRWAGFTKQDYFDAVADILAEDTKEQIDYKDKPVQPGEFDLRGYEIARVQYFQSIDDLSVTFSYSEIQFSRQCTYKLNRPTTIEILFDPVNHLLAIRPVPPQDRHAITWASIYADRVQTKKINGSAFLPVLFDILGWNKNHRYRVRGVRRQRDQETVLMFDLQEIEMFIPISKDPVTGATLKQPFELFDEDTTPMTSRSKKSLLAYPAKWASSFGTGVYQHEQAREIVAIDRDGQWGINQTGTPYHTGEELHTSSEAELVEGINTILSTIKQEGTNEQHA